MKVAALQETDTKLLALLNIKFTF